MPPLKVLVFVGSTRTKEKMGPFPGRLGDRVVKFILSQLPNDQFDVKVVDPSLPEFDLPLLHVPYHWAKATKKPVLENAQRLNDLVAWADAYILTSPEYNHTPSPGLINLLDYIAPVAYGGSMGLKPSHVVTYSMGKLGGARISGPLRIIANELGTLVCSLETNIIEAHLNLNEMGEEIVLGSTTSGKQLPKPITQGFIKAREELLFVGDALNKARMERKKSKL